MEPGSAGGFDTAPILYVKDGKRFLPMDWNRGHTVLRRIHATMFNREEKAVVEATLALPENAHLVWEWRK